MRIILCFILVPKPQSPVPTTVPHKNSINKGVDTFEIAMNLQLRKLNSFFQFPNYARQSAIEGFSKHRRRSQKKCSYNRGAEVHIFIAKLGKVILPQFSFDIRTQNLCYRYSDGAPEYPYPCPTVECQIRVL